MEARPRPNIIVTGTPGVGKSTLARLLHDSLEAEFGSFQYIPVSDWVVSKHLYRKWNPEFEVPEFDDDKICDELELQVPSGGLIVDFHSAGFFPESWIDLVVLLRADNSQIFDRLTARGYSDKKVSENIQCEILEVTHDDVFDNYKSEIVMELRSDTPEQMEENHDAVLQRIRAWMQTRG
mmetsp:Transcript_1182/g.2883  ORF Transcript_1182/g.2883 Transcript_1182/m.2883 type:complete len:180 (+) Transcript_1182:1747-2286(+)